MTQQIQVRQSDKSTRALHFSNLPGEVSEMDVLLQYMGDGNAATGIALDQHVVPFVKGAVGLAEKQKGKLPFPFEPSGITAHPILWARTMDNLHVLAARESKESPFVVWGVTKEGECYGGRYLDDFAAAFNVFLYATDYPVLTAANICLC